MKKSTLVLLALLIITWVLSGALYLRQSKELSALQTTLQELQEEWDESAKSNTEETTSTTRENYGSSTLGLSFSYPSVMNGNPVTVKEELNPDQDDAIGTVSLLNNDSVIASITVDWKDWPGANLTDILLGDSKTCSLELKQTGDGKSIYNFASTVSPQSADFDPKCQTLAEVYVFDAQSAKYAVVSTGQTPPFSTEDTQSFFDSILLFQ